MKINNERTPCGDTDVDMNQSERASHGHHDHDHDHDHNTNQNGDLKIMHPKQQQQQQATAGLKSKRGALQKRPHGDWSLNSGEEKNNIAAMKAAIHHNIRSGSTDGDSGCDEKLEEGKVEKTKRVKEKGETPAAERSAEEEDIEKKCRRIHDDNGNGHVGHVDDNDGYQVVLECRVADTNNNQEMAKVNSCAENVKHDFASLSERRSIHMGGTHSAARELPSPMDTMMTNKNMISASLISQHEKPISTTIEDGQHQPLEALGDRVIVHAPLDNGTETTIDDKCKIDDDDAAAITDGDGTVFGGEKLTLSMKPKGGPTPCPRCKSLDTKFCYYNNYNVKQPRYFCKVWMDV